MPRTECLSEAELSAFLLGEVPDTLLDDMADHLENCAHCEYAAQKLDDLSDTAVAALRRRSPDSTRIVNTDEKSTHVRPAQHRRPSGQDVAGSLPDKIGDYEILAELGRGGMGVVYKARHPQLRRVVALKMMLGGRFADPQFRARFRSEAEASARMQHPNIVQIFEIHEHEGQPYFTLEFVDGGNLNELVGKPQSPHRAAKWLETLARAVDYAHKQGIIHRDLKPANVLLTTDGQPKIADFGVAKLLEGSDIKTMSGMIVGTAEYMAPEQTDGKSQVGPAADIYALGAVLYTLLVCRPPFQSANVLDTLEQVKTQPPVPPRRLQPKLPRDLETICLTCLAKDPRKRYSTAADLADDLHRFLCGEPIAARRVSIVERTMKWVQRRPVIAGLIAAVAVVTLLGVGLAVWQGLHLLNQQKLADARHIAELEAKAKEAEARTTADRAAQKTKQAQAEAEAARKKTERESHLKAVTQYAAAITAAQQELQHKYLGRADDILSGCHPDLRGWEYDYLLRLCRRRLQTIATARCGYALLFSPDGKYLAGDTMDKTVKIWDVATRRRLHTLDGHSDHVISMAFSPDARLLATGSFDKSIKIWSVPTGKLVKTLNGHAGRIMCLAFGPGGDNLVSTSWSNDAPAEILEWDLRNYQRTRRFVGHKNSVKCLAFSPDGKWLASGSMDNTVKVWRVATGEEIFSATHRYYLEDVRFSADGHKLISCDHHWIKTWQGGETWNKPSLQQSAKIREGVFACTNGPTYASLDQHHTVKLWEHKSGTSTLTIKQHAKTRIHPVTKRPMANVRVFRALRISPDGQYLVNISTDGMLQFWNLHATKPARVLKGHAAGAIGLDFSPDGVWLASSSEDTTINIWNVATGTKHRTLKRHADFVNHVRFSPNGQTLASAGDSKDRDVKFWDTTNWNFTFALQDHARGVHGLAYHPDGIRLASSSQGVTKIWNSATRKPVLALQDSGMALAFSSDGNYLACASNPIKIWDTRTGKVVHTLADHKRMLWSIAYSPDGKLLASGGSDTLVKIWDTTTGKEIHSLQNHTFWISGVQFTPDGKRLISSSWDKTATVWDVTTGMPILTLEGNMDRIRSLAISADGKRLATGHDRGLVRIW